MEPIPLLKGLRHPELNVNLWEADLLQPGPPVEIALPEPEGPAAGELSAALGRLGVAEWQFRGLRPPEAVKLVENTAGLGSARRIAFAGIGPGIGRSTVVWAVARALTEAGFGVGLLEADVSNIELFGRFRAPSPALIEDKILPRSREGVRFSSLGAFFPAPELPWRGEALAKVTRQFLQDVLWNRPDFLLIDLPSGLTEAAREVLLAAGPTDLVLVEAPGGSDPVWYRRAVALAAETGSGLRGIGRNFACQEDIGSARPHFPAPETGPILASFPVGREGNAFWEAARELAKALGERIPDQGVTALDQ